jgi:GT2 family glycosyltransferase
LNKIPVIILNWNGIDDTIECVDSVLKQNFQDFTIFLIDNGSENDEFEKLSAKYGYDPRIVIQKNETNLGFTLGHNQLFEILKGSDAEYIALINNDAVADSYWLHKALNTAISEKADMVACKMLNYHDPNLIDNTGLFLLSSGEILPINNGNKINAQANRIKPVAACGGACLYRLKMLNEIGFFDPYFSTGYEDAELGLRVFLAGKKIVYDSDSIVYHKMSRSVSKIIDQKRIQKIQEDINYTYFKLMPFGAIAINALINIPRIIIIMILHLITFRIKFLKCRIMAIVRSIHDLKLIGKKRSEFRKMRKLNTCDILKAQQFSFIYDLKRFYYYVLNGRKNQFEKY